MPRKLSIFISSKLTISPSSDSCRGRKNHAVYLETYWRLFFLRGKPWIYCPTWSLPKSLHCLELLLCWNSPPSGTPKGVCSHLYPQGAPSSLLMKMAVSLYHPHQMWFGIYVQSLLCFATENVKWCSWFGKQFGSFSKFKPKLSYNLLK